MSVFTQQRPERPIRTRQQIVDARPKWWLNFYGQLSIPMAALAWFAIVWPGGWTVWFAVMLLASGLIHIGVPHSIIDNTLVVWPLVWVLLVVLLVRTIKHRTAS